MNVSRLIGRQIARIKSARDIVNIFNQLIQTVSLIIIALGVIGENITISMYGLLLLGGAFALWLIGYIYYKSDVIDYDFETSMKKTIRGSRAVNKEVWRKEIIPLLKEMLQDLSLEEK